MAPLAIVIDAVRHRTSTWPKAPGLAVSLTILWALEVFVVQELTLAPLHFQPLWSVVLYRVARLSLDVLACGALVCSLPRSALLPIFIVNPFFYVAVIVYAGYFHQPLSAYVITQQTSEGVSVADAFLPLVRSWHAVFLFSLVAKCVLLWRWSAPRSSWSDRKGPSLTLAVAYIVLVGFLNPAVQGLWKIGGWQSVSGLGSLYGYLWTWGAELVFIKPAAVRERALRRAAAGPPGGVEHLLQVEQPFPARNRLVFLQVESLDAAVIGFRIRGANVTPNLSSLATRSLRYVVQAPKGTGSCDADFRALMGREPSSEVPTYKIPGYPYRDSFVETLGTRGYRAIAVHGVTGQFFARRHPYEQMGFDELLFREELVDRGLAKADGWAVTDDDVLRVAGRRIAESRGKLFAMIITATSHIPFPVPEEYRHFFPDETAAEYAYFDSIRRLDAAIGRFVEALPVGTTLVLYGDHVSQMENPELGYEQITVDGVGCVPFLVHDVGRDLSSTQSSGKLATNGTLTMADAFAYVRSSVSRTDADR